MVNLAKGMVWLFCGVLVALSLIVAFFPGLPSALEHLLVITQLVLLLVAVYSLEEPSARRIREPKAYYFMTVVTLAAIVVIVLGGGFLFELGGWASLLRLVEVLLFLLLGVYCLLVNMRGNTEQLTKINEREGSGDGDTGG